MIEILLSNGDRAEADDPESAVRAARQLIDDNFDALPVQGRGRGLTVTFLVEGAFVRSVDAREISYGRA
jgi:hypothetical protein